MDTGQFIMLAGFALSIFTILLGVVALMWQINNQSSRLEAKIDKQGEDLRDEIREQGKRIDEQGRRIDRQGEELRAEIKEQGEDLRAEIKEQGRRIDEQGSRATQSELDQARINGVNSVLLRHTHTHENLGDAD